MSGARATFAALALACAMCVAADASPTSSPISGAPVPTASERALFEQGRSEERIAFGLERPEVFGIAVLRARSLADLTAAQALFGEGRDGKSSSALTTALETLRPLIDRGDSSGVDSNLWGSTFIEPYASTAPPNPKAWWIVEAGMSSIDVDAGRSDYLANYLQSIHPSWLASHVSYAGRFAPVMPAGGTAAAAAMQPQPLSQIVAALRSPAPTPSGSASPSPNLTDMQSYQSALSVNLAGVFPEPGYPAIKYGAGAIGDARHGVAIATATEMIGMPWLLGQRDSQAFFDALIASLKSSTGDSAVLAALADARMQLAVPEHAETFDAKPRYSASAADFAVYTKSIFGDRSRRMLVGNLAAGTFYNASISRDPDYDVSFRNVIGSISDLDGTITGLAHARQDLAAAKAGDWPDIRAKSLVIVELVMGST
jgi:hypothetical protein